jgi:hypothetical protein
MITPYVQRRLGGGVVRQVRHYAVGDQIGTASPLNHARTHGGKSASPATSIWHVGSRFEPAFSRARALGSESGCECAGRSRSVSSMAGPAMVCPPWSKNWIMPVVRDFSRVVYGIWPSRCKPWRTGKAAKARNARKGRIRPPLKFGRGPGWGGREGVKGGTACGAEVGMGTVNQTYNEVSRDGR